MSNHYPHYQQHPQHVMPQPPRKKRWPIVAAVLGGLFAGLISVSAVTSGSSGGDEPAVAASTTEPAAEATTDEATEEPTEPTVEASPDGSYTGSCAYELGEFMADEYKLTGEVDVENTGNVGIVVKVKISWPQYGMEPVKAAKKVRVPYGETKTVQFNRAATGTEIDRLQSWQLNHNFDDGCKYNGKMLDTFGQVHS